MCVHAHVHSLLVICVSLDDQEDQEAGKRDHAVEEQVGEQQPGPAADGRGGEHLRLPGTSGNGWRADEEPAGPGESPADHRAEVISFSFVAL